MWINQVRDLQGDETMVALVGNKTDLTDSIEVTTDDGVKKAQEEGILFVETSAKSNTGIDDLFQNILDILVQGDENTLAHQTQVGAEEPKGT